MKVATLIQALDLVGLIYCSEDGSQPANAVKKVLQQLRGAEDMTLAEWAEARRSQQKAAAEKAAASVDEGRVDQALARLEQADTHAALSAAIADLALNTEEWQVFCGKLTGHSATSVEAAREIVEQHFSDGLLLKERVESMKRQFG